MDVVPGYYVICSSSSGESNSEDESLIKSPLQQLEHMLSFSVVGQIRSAPSPIEQFSRVWMVTLNNKVAQRLFTDVKLQKHLKNEKLCIYLYGAPVSAAIDY